MEINLKINQSKKKWWVMKTNLNIILNLLWLISDNLSWLEVKCELQSCCYQRGNDTSIQIDIWCKVENIDARGCHPEDPPLFWSPMAHLGDPFQAVLVHVQKKMERRKKKKNYEDIIYSAVTSAVWKYFGFLRNQSWYKWYIWNDLISIPCIALNRNCV